jgi:dephospho-CoA kinase|tara:strand:- start:1373 stop:3451 length:2079 start_codon:yes stop_codon:yes gene_type:complete
MDKKFVDFVELDEGINDPGIFKAVFLAGGPGSGKSFVVGQTALTSFGLKLINSDIAFETALKKAGMDATPENIYTVKGQSLRDRAKKLTSLKKDGLLNGRLGLVIDGTGKDYQKIQTQKKALEKIGYDCAMIFVNTNEETAQSRNMNRDRTMPAAQVKKMWGAVQDNIGKFQNLFGANLHIVDNGTDADWKGATLGAYRKIGAWVKSPVSNYKATRWIKDQKKARGLKEAVPASQRIANRLKSSGVDLAKRAKERAAEHEKLKAQYASDTVKEEGGDIGRNKLIMRDRLGKSSMQRKQEKRKQALSNKLPPIKKIAEDAYAKSVEEAKLAEAQSIIKPILAFTWNKKEYEVAAGILKKIVDRKKKETGGRMRHGVEYYAQQVASQFHRNKVDARTLAKYYTEEYTAQKHEWGTPAGTKHYKDMTPGQGVPHEHHARPLTREELIKLNVMNKPIKEDYDQPHEDDEPAGAKTKAKYAADNAEEALLLPQDYEFSEVEILEMESDIEHMSFDDMVDLDMYDDSELDEFDKIEDFEADVEEAEEEELTADHALDEELSVQGRMKRRFHARRNRQKLKVARMRASRRAGDPARIKKRAQRGAMSVIKKRFARGRDIKTLPPAEKARLEKMTQKFSGLVSRLAVRMVPIVRKNELTRIKKGGGMKKQASKKFKVKKGGSSSKYKAKKFKIAKPKKKK